MVLQNYLTSRSITFLTRKPQSHMFNRDLNTPVTRCDYLAFFTNYTTCLLLYSASYFSLFKLCVFNRLYLSKIFIFELHSRCVLCFRGSTLITPANNQDNVF